MTTQACSGLIAAALGLVAVATPALAQNAPQCPMSGSPSDWGINSIATDDADPPKRRTVSVAQV